MSPRKKLRLIIRDPAGNTVSWDEREITADDLPIVGFRKTGHGTMLIVGEVIAEVYEIPPDEGDGFLKTEPGPVSVLTRQDIRDHLGEEHGHELGNCA